MSLFTRQALAPTLALFTSAGTLVCCALPALLITLGMGAALAGLTASVPQLVWFSQYKGLVFGLAGVMLIVASLMRWRSRNDPCPVDPAEARACARLRLWGGVALWAAILVYLTGAFFAFAAWRFI